MSWWCAGSTSTRTENHSEPVSYTHLAEVKREIPVNITELANRTKQAAIKFHQPGPRFDASGWIEENLQREEKYNETRRQEMCIRDRILEVNVIVLALAFRNSWR